MSEAPNGSDNGAGEGGEGAGNPGEGQATDWTTGLSDEWKGYAGVKGWENPEAVLQSYKNLESHVGVPLERIVKLPGEDADPSAWDEVYTKLGRPEAANGYELELPEGVQVDQARVDHMREAAFKVGLSPTQLNALAAADAEFMQGKVSEDAEANKAAFATADADLRKEWGAGYDRKVAQVEATAAEFGMEEDQLLALRSAMGPANAMKFMATIGERLGEDTYEGGREEGKGFSGNLTPAEAKASIQELNMNPEFMKKYLNGDAAAVTRMSNLHALAHGG